MDFKNKKVLVCGLGRSGIASAVLLKKLGASVTASDIRDKKELDLTSLKDINIYAGRNPDDIINNYDLIIISPGISTNLSFVKLARKLKIPVWSEIELAYRVCKTPIIAITGTNGKTTTTTLTGEIIKNYYINSLTAGNIGLPLTEKICDIKKDSYVVAEISSFQLETIDLFQPHIAVILNITPDHLDRHKTFENYCDIKSKIFCNQNKNDFIILNYDDEICRKLESQTNSHTIFFSTKQKLINGVFIDKDKIKIRLEKFIDINNQELMSIKDINLIGEHNLSNILAAIAASVCANVPLNIIINTIKNFHAVPHRLEFVRNLNGVDFYNDSKATNVDSAIKALKSIKKPIILIGGGYDKKVDFYDWIRSFKNVKRLILIGEVKEKIASQCCELGFTNFDICENLADAVEKSFESAQKGDCVLLSPACASWDMFKNFEQRGDLFKTIVNSLE